jgi:hypothetical protein
LKTLLFTKPDKQPRMIEPEQTAELLLKLNKIIRKNFWSATAPCPEE